jgi:Holliday junction resolvase
LVTTPYQRGRSREYKALNILRNDGWVCSRSAMSHGPIDIFAAKRGRVLLIQVKSGKGRLTEQEAVEVCQWSKAFGAVGEVWFFKKKGGLVKKKIYTPRKKSFDQSGRIRVKKISPHGKHPSGASSR